MDAKNLNLIAKGSASQIYHCRTKNGEYVLKYVPLNCQKQIDHLSNQAKVLSVLKHDNIIKYFKHMEKLSLLGKKQNSQLRDFGNLIVLQYTPQGTLVKLIEKYKLPPAAIKNLFKKICQALKYIHFKGYSHRDLKLQNILIFKSKKSALVPKISDFGFATYCYKDGELLQFRNVIGTQKGYMAPQIHEVESTKEPYDAFKADIFCLGVIMFALVFGRLPFQYSKKANSFYKLIIEKDYQQFWKLHQKRIQQLNLYDNLEDFEKFKDLFQRMVNQNPQQRPTISEVLDNSWFNI